MRERKRLYGKKCKLTPGTVSYRVDGTGYEQLENEIFFFFVLFIFFRIGETSEDSKKGWIKGKETMIK